MPTEQQSHLWTNKRRKVDHAQVDEGPSGVHLLIILGMKNGKLNMQNKPCHLLRTTASLRTIWHCFYSSTDILTGLCITPRKHTA